MDDLKKIFLEEAQELLVKAESGMMALDGGDHSQERLNEIFRVAHSFKGSAKSVGFDELGGFSHKFEDVLTSMKEGKIDINQDVCTLMFEALDVLKQFVEGLCLNHDFTLDTGEIREKFLKVLKASPEEKTSEAEGMDFSQGFGIFDDTPAPAIHKPTKVQNKTQTKSTAKNVPVENDAMRVSIAKIDALLNVVGELVVNYNMLMNHRNKGSISSQTALHTMGYTLSIVKEIQDTTMSLRMVPVKPLVQKLQRAVRDVATQLSKQINFKITGEHVELEKTVLEKITDPLTHLVRNAVDHGVEENGVRPSIGKNEVATINLEFHKKEDQVEIIVSDDGKGIDQKRVLKKAIENKIVQESEVSNLSSDSINQLIMMPGFSTKEVVSEISGRGVGLDVVKTAVEELKGTIVIESKMGQGSVFKILLPQSFSIIAGFVVDVDHHKYIIPVTQLVETMEFSNFTMEPVTGIGRVINLRGQVIPVFSLSEILHKKKSHDPVHQGQSADKKIYKPGLVTSVGGKKFSFEVDEIIGQQQVVLKKLGHEMQGIPGVTAGAILASGDPGLVLDLVEIAKRKGGLQHAS